MESKRLAIIGGGAAGFFCAANLALTDIKNNLRIIIYEQLPKPMLKLLATGGERCNITNNINDISELVKQYPRGEKFLYSAFKQFSPVDTVEWFKDQNIPVYIDESGCVFPESDKAKNIADTLYKILNKRYVSIINDIQVEQIVQQDDKLAVISNEKTELFDFILIATGGCKSINKNIRTYNGYEIAKQLGHSIISPKLVLSGLIAENKNLSRLSGIVLKEIKVTAKYKDKKIAEQQGDLLLTHKGVSGPVILNLSSLIKDIKYNSEHPMNLLIKNNDYKDINEADKYLIDILSKNSNKDIINILAEFYPKNFASFILSENKIKLDTKAHSITKAQRKILASNIYEYSIKIVGIDSDSAIVTAGGVNTKEIDSKTMMSKLVPNVYFAGEVIDVDGFCGGFNLQFAWSSGYIVAKHVTAMISKKNEV